MPTLSECGLCNTAISARPVNRRYRPPVPVQCRQRIGMWLDLATMHTPNSKIGPNQFRKCALRAMREMERCIDVKLYLDEGPDSALIHVSFGKHNALATASRTNGSCKPGVMRIVFHELGFWDEQTTYVTFLHELGHNLGLDHIPGKNIMNAGLQTSLQGYSEADINAFVAQGYSRWISSEGGLTR